MTALEHGLSQIGIKEITGNRHNPEVLKYFVKMGIDWVKDDETAWCSAYMNWCMMMEGKDYSGKLNARSWLSIGKSVKVPKINDVVVFWRENINSWKGHVGFFIREDGNKIYTLGGNQNNSVCVKIYKKDQLLDYRRI